MQTIGLPSSILQCLNSLCRNFLWGSMEEQRSLHTIAWSKICWPRQFGGLGLTPLKAMNEAVLVKMVWKLAQQQDDMPSRVLTAKYGG